MRKERLRGSVLILPVLIRIPSFRRIQFVFHLMVFNLLTSALRVKIARCFSRTDIVRRSCLPPEFHTDDYIPLRGKPTHTIPILEEIVSNAKTTVNKES